MRSEELHRYEYVELYGVDPYTGKPMKIPQKPPRPKERPRCQERQPILTRAENAWLCKIIREAKMRNQG